MPVVSSYQQGQFSWVDLSSKNLPESQAFYSELLGWKAVEQDTQGGPHYVIFTVDDKKVAGGGQMPSQMLEMGLPSFWNCYVSVDDLDASIAKATELGATISMPKMKVVEAGWMAFIQDPAGANVALWQKNEHFGAELVNDPGSWCWNDLATRDLDKATAFYGNMFGWTFEEASSATGGKYLYIKMGDLEIGGMLEMSPEMGEMPPCWGVYFTVADLEKEVGRVAELGGQNVVPIMQIPIGRFAVFTDPHGGAFSLFEFCQE